MKSHKLLWVDVFTRSLFKGNPCAVVFDADDLHVAQMQTLAMEMGLSETAFILKSDRADYKARYFTPTEELPLAGHPTLAVIHALIDQQHIVLTEAETSISLELNVGVISITILNKKFPEIFMEQKKPEFLSTHNPIDICPLFNLNPDDLLDNVPLQTVSTGTPQLMVALNNHESLKKVTINADAYKSYRAQSDFSSPHFFCLGGVTAEGDTFARHLSIFPDVIEDPFTGSATGGMAAFLWKYQLIHKTTFIAEQGHWMGRPGQAKVQLEIKDNDIHKVIIGGAAITLFDGQMRI